MTELAGPTRPGRCTKCGDTFPIHSLSGTRVCPVAELEAKLAAIDETVEMLQRELDKWLQ